MLPPLLFTMTAEQTLAQIRQKESVAVLVIHPDDELCARAKQTFLIHEGKLRSRGFRVMVLEMNQKTLSSEELACVRVPQLRFFLRGKLQHKVIGLFDESVIDAALKVLT
jgi:hypothetical protein